MIATGEGIGETNDYGPLTAQTIRELLAGLHRMGATATWRCLITDDNPTSPAHGTILGIGKAPHALVRTATGLLRELVQAREQCCTFPGCRRRAVTCEVDHRIPHSEDGATCECNLHPLCNHHHRLRERGFTPTLIDPGTGLPITQWVTPTGRTIRTETEHPPF
ncbi:MAG: HNH endonuclease signature motif containing protein [Kineosporiaceae bacterium]